MVHTGPVRLTAQSVSRPRSSTGLCVLSLLLECGNSRAALMLTSTLTKTADEFLSCAVLFCSILVTDEPFQVASNHTLLLHLLFAQRPEINFIAKKEK